MSKSFRNREIMVSARVFDALSALAVVRELDCPDAVADIELGKLLEASADLQWAVARRKKDNEAFRRDYAERVAGKQPDDQIP